MPRKKVIGSPKHAAEKKTRGRQKVVRPALKTPSLVKVQLKIPTATVTHEENIGCEVITNKEAEVPEIKNDRIVKRKYVRKKTSNDGQTAASDAPLKRKRQVKATYKNVATRANIAAGSKCNIDDTAKIDANYYKILLANDVVKLQFPNTSKYVNNDLHDKLIGKKVCVNNSVLKNKVPKYGLQTATKKLVKKIQCNRSNVQVSRKNTRHNSECKPDKPSKIAAVETRANKAEKITKSKQLPKKTSLKKFAEENHCLVDPNPTSKVDVNINKIIDTKKPEENIKRKRKLSLNRNKLRAGPLRSNLKCKENEQITFIKEKTLQNIMNDEVIIKDKTDDNFNNDKFDENKGQESTSSLISWAKDISSSSNSSLVTIHSNGLHCFDNKIPVVQLSCINQKSEHNDGHKPNDISKCIVNNYCLTKEPENETNRHHYPFINNKCRLSRSSSSSPDHFNFRREQYGINNGTVIEENIGDITQASLHLSASSISSTSFPSSSSSSSSSSTCGNITPKKDTNNSLSSEKMVENTLAGEKKSPIITDFELKEVLQKLNLNIKKCDFDTIKLSNTTLEGTNVKGNVQKLQDKLFRNEVLKQETALCNLCYHITQLEIDDVDKYFNHSEQLTETCNNACPNTPETYFSKDSELINEHVDECNKQTYDIDKQIANGNATETNEIVDNIDSNNKSNHTCDNDDDDALSLFAESLTGLETCRRNSTYNADISESEEYVPPPAIRNANQPRTLISYQPTKISNTNENEIPNNTMISEKQKADSTALLIDPGNNPNVQENMIYEDRIGDITVNQVKLPNIDTKNTPDKPRLMSLNYRPTHGLKSSLFKGYCFFYILSNCKKHNCKFPHEYPNVEYVKNILQRLNEESVIQEYMLARSWPQLRRIYGLCFLEECTRRELTRIVVEMALDFIVKTNKNINEDNAIKAEVVDNVLMYLNNVDLSTCDDLLLYNVRYFDSVELCDHFMGVIATSQNFSRFKPVFVKLTDFMYQNGRSFSIDVAESILERFCILPYDDLLARALLRILKNTDATVFSNTKINDLERQLEDSNKQLHQELKLLKEYAVKQHKSMDADKKKRIYGHMDKNVLQYSPDTTDLCNVGITPMRTTFKRTINTDKLAMGNNTNMQNQSSSHVQNPQKSWTTPGLSRVDDHTNTKSNNATDCSMKKWMYRSIFDSGFLSRSLNTSPVWPQRPPFKRLSDRSFNEAPKMKFKRNAGPTNHY